MKKLMLLVCVLVMFVMSANAEVVVNGVDINKLDIRFCQLMAKAKFLSTKISIVVDYGQKTKLWGKAQKIEGSDGKTKKFYSVIDALNFMDANGWEHVDSYFLTKDKSNVLHFLFKKKGT
jgi:hypothetical protein